MGIRWAGAELALARIQRDLETALGRTWRGRLVLRLARWYTAWRS
ncbi:hypothetical protein [Kitasatospora purpeofusca]|nr:hypothetical protein [Kitasatospora purpeofusca]MCX4752906.1 hypothetical protein [Kitasatospora purpeofusca]WSR40537.1 hypothetical protein OG196_16320 [Kitasatospora purpeofusca]